MGRKGSVNKQAIIIFLLLANCFLQIRAQQVSQSVVIDHACLRIAHSMYDSGTIHIFLKNLSDEEIRVEKIFLNITALIDLPNDVAFWWQSVPNPIPPKRISAILIKLAESLPLPIEVKIELSNGNLIEQRIDKIQTLKISFVGFDLDNKTIYVYLENLGDKPLNVERLFLDSQDITSQITNPVRAILPLEKNCLAINLKEPLRQGEFITLKLETMEGEVAEATVRVFSYFPITSWDGDNPKELNFDSPPFLNLYTPNPEKLVEFKTRSPNMVHLLFDDPAGMDIKNSSSEGNSEPSLGQVAMEIVSYNEDCHRFDPQHLTTICLRDTEKFRAYFIYGELADSLAIHPCEGVYYMHRPIRDAYLTALGKLACEPRPLLVLPEAFRAIGRCGASPRYPTPEELRLIVYYEIANGAKGLLYYKKSGLGGFETQPDLSREIGKINREISEVKELLKIGDTFQLAEASNPQVETYSILCGDKAIALILINHDYDCNFSSASRAFNYRVKKNFAVTIDIPLWLEIKEAYEISEGGKSIPVRFRIVGRRKAIIYVKELDLTKMIILKTKLVKGE